MKSIYIIGAGGHGLVVAELAESCGYNTIAFLDDRWPEVKQCGTYPVVGKVEDNSHLLKTESWVVAIGNNATRLAIQERYKEANHKLASLIHPNATVSKTSVIESGVVVMAGAVINAYVYIGTGCILNTSCSVDHECVLQPGVHVSPNCGLAGNVLVGKETMIGIGANVIQGIEIGNNTVVGAGSTVVNNISSNKVVVGSPAKELKRIK